MNEERDIGKEIVEGLEEAKTFVEGESDGPRIHTIDVDMIDIKSLRNQLALTQKQFARLFGFKLNSVQNWEQGRRRPDKATRILLRLIEEKPQQMIRRVRNLASKTD
jgi:putative transcriptional regulator